MPEPDPNEKTTRLYRWTRYGKHGNKKSAYKARRTRPWDNTTQPHVPMPNRQVPTHIASGAHKVHPAAERDWTLETDDKGVELELRGLRNAMIKHMLTSGRPVQYRSTGNSLRPIGVFSGDVTMWEPITDPNQLVIGEVVWCQVRPSLQYYGHVIYEIEYWENENGSMVRCFWIGNLDTPPWFNGWCYEEDIFGRLFEASGVQPDDYDAV